ncbi:CueP family metal-binding protein [Amphibacillus sp. MSJ-3]|uniref:CueP family metal-binding protein n=1 Tax=Amphibacillus sp. MSJ-3 TaxID=2841505 RepID=UPI001C0F0316|nr:CueP family metal-binding protein [Amphibacillus sp. MSJ-3]MBU5595495.1 CueP family metal-binding protein [Amphibacillus sp. MSJ-3]
MKFKLSLLVLVSLLFLSACQGKENALKDEEIKKLVHDYSIGQIANEEASITGTELIVTKDNGEENVYPLPEDDFFVSIAPFINQTHPCTFHNLTGCQGEMPEEEFEVTILDSEGNTVLDDKVNTLANGFFDLWLPRDETYHVTIRYEDKEVEAELSTFSEDPTCVTTMQLT